MPPPREPRPTARRWAWAIAAGTSIVVTLVAWELWTDFVDGLLAKEGSVEQLSHLVLLASAAVWAALARRPPRTVAVGLACVSVLLWLEEIDWGAIYGVDVVGGPIERALGDPNLHNLSRGLSYVLFGVPLAVFFAAPSRWLGRHAPVIGERVGALGCGVLLALTHGPREALAQEGLEALLYASLLVCGARCLWSPSTSIQ